VDVGNQLDAAQIVLPLSVVVWGL